MIRTVQSLLPSIPSCDKDCTVPFHSATSSMMRTVQSLSILYYSLCGQIPKHHSVWTERFLFLLESFVSMRHGVLSVSGILVCGPYRPDSLLLKSTSFAVRQLRKGPGAGPISIQTNRFDSHANYFETIRFDFDLCRSGLPQFRFRIDFDFDSRFRLFPDTRRFELRFRLHFDSFMARKPATCKPKSKSVRREA